MPIALGTTSLSQRYVGPVLQPPYKPVSATPQGRPDPARVGVMHMTPCFEHFCAVCGAGASFGFGGDFMRGEPGVWACSALREVWSISPTNEAA